MKFYQVRGRSLEPDIVVLCFFENDFRDNQRHWYFDDDAKPIPLPYNVSHPTERSFPLRSWLVDHSRVAYLSKLVITNYLLDQGLKPELAERYLRALRDEVSKDGARLAVFYIPMKSQLNGSTEEQTLAEITRKLNIAEASFSGSLSSDDYLPEGHWNAEGHEIAAKTILSFIASVKN